METSIHRNTRASLLWLAGTVLLAVGLTLPAYAALGGDANSVHADQAHMKGSLKTTQAQTYAVHEIKTPVGTAVREYVSPDGRVFGVAWQGPSIPDIRQILGVYFQQYSAAASEARSKHVRRGPLNIQQPGLVVQTNGHVWAYSGRAYVPEMVPQGVKAEDIR